MKFLLCLLTSVVSAMAGEYAVLQNGFRIHADTHEVDGAVVRLHSSTGVTELQASLVASFEPEEYSAPVPAPVVAVPAATVQPVEPQRKLTPQELVTRAAIRAGLPPGIVHSIARAESGYRTDALSPKGAIGLMQLMPGTASQLKANPYDPAQNADAGARYLRDLLLRYENDPHQVSKAVAAYNAGPGAVDKYHGIPPYRETVQYVNRVLKQYEKEQRHKQPDVTD